MTPIDSTSPDLLRWTAAALAGLSPFAPPVLPRWPPAALAGPPPFAFVVLLLKLADRRARWREYFAATQSAITDAIHERLGAVVAPTLRRSPGRWKIDRGR